MKTEDQNPSTSAPTDDEDPIGPDRSLLIVDDDGPFLRRLARAMETRGFAVDTAETPDGRAAAWEINATGPAALARIATEYGLTLVHISSDYVYDGTSTEPYPENAPVSPLSVYGQSKAAGDLAAATTPRHYIIRTSWVIGDGNNFVRTMANLAARGIDPNVIDDQHGRLTFTDDLARGIHHLLTTGAPHGTYNLTGTGPARTWADIAREVYRLTGHDPARVTPVGTEAYYAQATGPIAPRPHNSILDLEKLTGTGYKPQDSDAALKAYVSQLGE